MRFLIEWLRGPGLWLAFGAFALGTVCRIVILYRLSKKKDGIVYNHVSLPWAFRSIGHWLIPLGARSLRIQPFFSIICYVFHLLLFIVPFFLIAHTTLFRKAFGISLWSLPNAIADIFTILFIASACFLALRRLLLEEVRILSSFVDYFIIFMTVFPFATGYMASHYIGNYDLLLMLHVLSGDILIAMIPFSKLFHAVLFFFTRAFIGFEMGTRRGAMPW